MMCFTWPPLLPFNPRILADTRPAAIHATGVLLFLFIPLVLFLFLRFPWGILPCFAAAIVIMFSHRFAAIPFMNRHRTQRCLWCGRTARARETLTVDTGSPVEFQACRDGCSSRARRFFDFCLVYKNIFRLGIFLPLAWYVVTMLLNGFGLIRFPIDWDRFIFQFCIACSVVSISFFYTRGKETQHPAFAFPIHNLFLLGIKNTLLVFRYVGIWWIAAGLYFLYRKL